MNKLILGDNLEILRNMDDECVDLIYLDPPFFSNRNYEVIWGDKGEIRSFEDRWSGGIDHYIAWLKERVVEMHRVLKSTGSIFLHCDWHADAYIRVYILDKIFDSGNFVSDICWKRTTAKSNSHKIANNTDTIFFYSKSKDFIYNQEYRPLKEKMVKSHYNKRDSHGRIYRTDNLIAPSKGYMYEWKGVKKRWRCPIEKMKQLEEEGRLQYTKNGTAEYIRYLEDSKGVPIDNFWSDIFPVNSQAKERIGYPTQKPEKLLERIVLCASNEGDIVLDPFVGGGTTLVVADRLKRQWIGIDQSVQAVKVSEMRLQKQRTLFSLPFVLQLHKYDYDMLRYKEAFEFEHWIIQQLGGVVNIKQRGDKGIDGRTPEGTPIQAKRSDNIGRNVVDNFKSACERFDRNLFQNNKKQELPVGIIIAFSFGKGAIQEVARLKNEEDTVVQLTCVDEIVPIAMKPKINLQYNYLGTDKNDLQEIEFTAVGESEAGVEFYAWDWDFDESQDFQADILIDKKGKQKHKFEAGTHHIAVKIVDNEGLESVEMICLKINGEIQEIIEK